MKVIEAEHLTKKFGQFVAVDNISFEVEKGEIFGFLGANGAGKTTTIRCMLDMIRPRSGSIKIFGIDPQVDPKTVHANVGYLPGELNLEANMKVKNALRYFVQLRGNQIDWDYALELAERLELDLENSIKNLSKGNKQKVGLVQALMHKPELLIMDEPTTALDVTVEAAVLDLIAELRRDFDTAIMYITHNLGVVAQMTEYVIVMYMGKVVEEANVDTIYYNPKHPYTQALLSAIPKLGSRRSGHIKLKGEVPTPINLPSGCVFHGRCVHADRRCVEEVPEAKTVENDVVVACHGVEEGRL